VSLLIYCLVTLALIALAAGLLERKLRRLRRMLRRQEQHVWQTQNIFQLFRAPLAGSQSQGGAEGWAEGWALPPPGGWSAGTELLGELMRLVAERQPQRVVELGSGLSTLVLAAALRRSGAGQLVSIEADAQYAQRTHRELERLALTAWASVRVVPLTTLQLEGETRPWYDTALLEDLTQIDLLLVDGPPTALRRDIRYPAVPFFWERLSAGAVVLLDDAARPAEAASVRRWQQRFPTVTVELLRFEKGAARLTKRG
jgi:predicted O-methyltransferase YrrM